MLYTFESHFYRINMPILIKRHHINTGFPFICSSFTQWSAVVHNIILIFIEDALIDLYKAMELVPD